MHVADPDPNFSAHRKAWCGAAGAATSNGTVDCPECIERLVAFPGYYNQLRAAGLRTKAERQYEEEQQKE